jgi:single-strand DNA-binding protein
MALNKVMLIGNVGNDPEIRYLDSNPQGPQGNAKVASFRLATTERYRDRNGEVRENTEWHSIVAWRNNADLVEKFVHKGSQIYVEGKLRTRQWNDQSGNKRYTTEINADNIQLLGKRPDGPDAPAAQPASYQSAPASQPAPYQTAPASRPAPQPAGPAPQPGFPASAQPPVELATGAPEDDLPF